MLSEDKDTELTLDEARQLGPEFGKAMGQLRKEGIDGTSFNESVELEVSKAKESDQYKQERAQAEEILAEARERQLEHLRGIYQDLAEKESDPKLIEAFDAWGNSPDSKNDRGPDGKGFNAGLIHYFEYRSNAEKNGRFKNESEPFGVDGFIEYSNHLKSLVDNPEGENVSHADLFQDSIGQRRMYTLSNEGDLIISFQRPNEELRIVTAIPGQKEKEYQRIVSRVTEDENYLNRFTGDVEQVPLEF